MIRRRCEKTNERVRCCPLADALAQKRYLARSRISFHFLTEEAAGQVLMVRWWDPKYYRQSRFNGLPSLSSLHHISLTMEKLLMLLLMSVCQQWGFKCMHEKYSWTKVLSNLLSNLNVWFYNSFLLIKISWNQLVFRLHDKLQPVRFLGFKLAHFLGFKSS